MSDITRVTFNAPAALYDAFKDVCEMDDVTVSQRIRAHMRATVQAAGIEPGALDVVDTDPTDTP
jgi:hypothetical protein